MKIALINNQPLATGVGRYSFSIYENMKEYMDIDHFFIDRKKGGIYKIVDNNDSLLVKKGGLNLLPMQKLSNLSLDYLMGRYIPDNYDLYHITNQNMSILNYYNNIGVNVLTVHDIIYFTHPRNPMQKILSKLLYKGVKNTDFIISVSHSTQQDLVKHFNIPPENIKVIPEGVNSKFKPLRTQDLNEIYLKYNLDENDTHILHVGEDSPRKNLKVILKAFKLLLIDNKIKNLKLIKINGMDTKLIKKMGLEDQVIVLENVLEEELPKFYNLADVFVFPSLYEGFGLPLIEAMACGLPIIASNVTSIPEIVGDAGILLYPQDFKGFYKSIYSVLTDESLRVNLSYNGVKRSKMFSWRTCAKDTLNVYKDISKDIV